MRKPSCCVCRVRWAPGDVARHAAAVADVAVEVEVGAHGGAVALATALVARRLIAVGGALPGGAHDRDVTVACVERETRRKMSAPFREG